MSCKMYINEVPAYVIIWCMCLVNIAEVLVFDDDEHVNRAFFCIWKQDPIWRLWIYLVLCHIFTWEKLLLTLTTNFLLMFDTLICYYSICPLPLDIEPELQYIWLFFTFTAQSLPVDVLLLEWGEIVMENRLMWQMLALQTYMQNHRRISA